jgi:hypothetical protein
VEDYLVNRYFVGQYTKMDLPTNRTEDHRKIIEDILVALQQQEDLLKGLGHHLGFFRKRYKELLNHDIGAGQFLSDQNTGQILNLRSHQKDLGNFVVTVETAAGFWAYKYAVENLQMGVEKSKEAIEGIWKKVLEVWDDDHRMWAKRDEVMISENWVVDTLEQDRRAAAQE